MTDTNKDGSKPIKEAMALTELGKTTILKLLKDGKLKKAKKVAGVRRTLIDSDSLTALLKGKAPDA